MIIEAHKDLTRFNTLGFKSNAKAFVAIHSEADLVGALNYARENGLSIHVLSGGSNILVAPEVDGLVLYMDIMTRQAEVDDQHVFLTLGAGEGWHETVQWSVEQGYFGIESMALIPGKVGAAPVQNIGAYGAEISDVLVSVRAYDREKEGFVTLEKEDCRFAYRDSLFKQSPGRFIITEVTLKLSTAGLSNVRYDALESYFTAQGILSPDLMQVFQAVCEVRRSKLPDPAVLGNAGSFFKNPVVCESRFNELKTRYPNIIAYPDASGNYKLAAGWLIDQCQWKGHRQGAVGVYAKQALVLVHYGLGALDALLQLAKEIQNSVETTFGVSLEIEPQPFPVP